ncbi:hypothetical protein [uncultured Stenotrophomonas sp.]|uniref:hypothetical protein n=1 Tax=uncultured Stenotrophomonas sp. TaxID=165438 RepID=UPI0025D25BE6|nr:hypothetical protein [uncultured Stenotrophomonas sp.]
MATDKTAFDDFLKEALYRDILFRVVVWAIVAGLATCYARGSAEFTSIAHLQRVADSLAPMVNTIGVTAIVFSVVALALKDLENVSPGCWDQSSTAGRLGGIIRRLAGDLTLWVIGALVTLLSAVVFVAFDAYFAGQMTWGNFRAIFMMFSVFILFAAIVSFLNVLVRRSVPLLTNAGKCKSVFSTAQRVAAAYAAVLLLICLVV